MKKKLLFVIPSLDSGGGEKSLVNLLNTIDFSLYKVDVLLFKEQGLFLNLLPKEVRVTFLSGDYVSFTKDMASSILFFLKNRNFNLIFHRIAYSFKIFTQKNKAVSEQKSWKNLSQSIAKLKDEYDVAIGFLEKSSVYLVVDKVNAKNKIGWIHTNYSSSGMSSVFDTSYFSKLNSIVTVSEECKNDLAQHFPENKDKLHIIYNIVAPKLIHDLSNAPLTDFDFDDNSIILTIARLSPEKGIDIAIKACAELVKSNSKIKWLVIGEGNQRKHLEELIQQNNLEQHFYLLGLKQNPYPYLKKADVYVQPSRYEGKSIAIDEAKILAKPIVVTNFETAKDQINNGINGMISSMEPSQLAKDIFKVLSDENSSNKWSTALLNDNFGTENEIEKLYLLINSGT